ncbi:MAG: diaminopimelate decarboxylase [Robiginitomaculum sp.]|nr:MAG: diaminopimelate decarboxylase [Robiginitomaculum sp.]
MRHFHFQDGQMMAENVSLHTIADEVGTPVYVYSAATLKRHYQVFEQAISDMDALIAFSVKANSNIAVLALLAKLGAGADVVSGGELTRALMAGMPAQKIVFSGVGKTMDEMRAALEADILQFNVESMPELYALDATARALNTTARIAFRINPDVSAGGHAKITTGKAENKFGINIDQAESAYAEAASLGNIEIVGIDMHIGSQIDTLAPFKAALTKGIELIKTLRASGHNIRSYDFGGGLGIPYNEDENTPPLPALYGQMIAEATIGLDLKMIFEPGRLIAGNAGILLSKTVYVKKGSVRNFIILDAAMNDLIRPALYDAHHHIEPVTLTENGAPTQTYDIVGPVCETGDTFAKHRDLPEISAGDLIVIHSAGAYGAVQAGQYNTRPLIPEVLVSGDKYEIIRERPSVEDILKTEHIPDWV